MRASWVVFCAFIQEAFARQVVVNSKHVWWARILQEPIEFGFINTQVAQVSPNWRRAIQATTQQIEAQPAALILKLCLIRK
jgi:hypothetical protein